MRHYLVVANQTLGGDHLLDTIRSCMDDGPCSFHVVVPATHPKDQWVWTEGHARQVAARRLQTALERFAALGAKASGEVGDARPLTAIRDAMIDRDAHEIILSTLPSGPSQWLRQDLPAKVVRTFGLPVRHLIADPEPVTPVR
jgi:hypothetical protein